jgi:antitoxin VapB
MRSTEEEAMSLNIKDPQAHHLAQALARETGETMTRAVTEALRERLERVRRRKRPEAKAEELLAIGRRCAKALKGRPVDHGSLLYDEHGLPR